MTDTLFALRWIADAKALARRAMDLGTEVFAQDRLGNPGGIAMTTAGFDELLDLAGILGHRSASYGTVEEIRQVRDETLRASMLAIYARGLIEHSTPSQKPLSKGN